MADIAELQAFERAVREGSFSKAAWALNLAQPTISARIKALEQELGGPLFVRGGRRLILTERGENLLPYARRALAILEEGLEATRLTPVGQHGRVTVGTLPSLAGGFLAEAIANFSIKRPRVELFVRTGHSDQISEMLHDGVAKLGLLTWPYTDRDLLTLARFREPLSLVLSAEHPLAKRGTLTMAEVQRESRPFLMVNWGISMTPVLAELDPESGPVIEVPLETVLFLLRRGIGAAFMTRMFVADDLASGRLVAVPVSGIPPLVRDTALVRLARGTALPAVTAEFVEELRDAAGPLLING